MEIYKKNSWKFQNSDFFVENLKKLDKILKISKF